MAGALATGIAAAATVSLDRPGLGWPLTSLIGAVTVAVTARRAQRASDGDRRTFPAERIGWAIATLVLLADGAIRAAGWLLVLCVLTACGTAALAAAGGRSAWGMVAGMLTAPAAATRALPWAARGLSARRTGGGRTAVAVAATLALLLMFGSLFSSADAGFARLLDRVMPDIDAGTVTRWTFLFWVGAVATLALAFLASSPPDLSGLESPGRSRLHRLEWALPLAGLNVLFASFVGVQLAVLFGGSAYVLGPGGPSYAEYARSGFWQLLTVTVLTVLVLGLAARWAPRRTRSDRVLVRLLLGGLAALTLVIVASALHRMHTYEQAYGFTRLRLLVSVCELWLGVVFVLILAAGVRLRGGWLARAAVASGVAALIGLVTLNPDRFIAERNVDRYEQTGRIDTAYLAGLSADAAPALRRLPEPLRGNALDPIMERLGDQSDGWTTWNLGRHTAHQITD